MIPIKQIEKGVAAYLDAEIMPQLPNSSLEKVLAGTAMSLVIRRSGNILESYKDNKAVQMLGLMDSDGNVDVDILSEELKKNISNDGLKVEVPIIGKMTFHKDDVDKLHNYIMGSEEGGVKNGVSR